MLDFSPEALLQKGLYVILLLLSLAVHEFAHAWSAWRLGDDTAALEGRLTLNPFAHADPLGTFVLPLLGVPFGWAKPVNVNPVRFRRNISMGAGMAVTASAGPISNLLLATFSAIALGLVERFAPSWAEPGTAGQALLLTTLYMNVGLTIFNLIPLPPLDGSRIVAWLVPSRFRDQWHAVEHYAPFLLFGVVWLSVRTGFLSVPIDTVAWFLRTLTGA